VDAVASGRLPVEPLIEPLVVRGLLARGPGLDPLEGPEELGAPRIDLIGLRVGLCLGPLDADDGPPIADELGGQLVSGRLGEELRRLDLLRQHDRLLLGA
jgi:hypothetical protein